MSGFTNDIQSSFENLSQEKIQSAIDIQPKVMKAIIAADGGHTTYMSNGSAKKRITDVFHILELDDNVLSL